MKDQGSRTKDEGRRVRGWDGMMEPMAIGAYIILYPVFVKPHCL